MADKPLEAANKATKEIEDKVKKAEEKGKAEANKD